MVKHSPKKVTIKKPQAIYSKYYKILLILSTIGTILSLLGGLLSLPQLPSSFSVSAVYGILTGISYITVIVAAIALWQLWKKQHIGLILKLSTYGSTILTSIIMLAVDKPIIAMTIDHVRQQTIQSGKVANEKLIDAVVHLTFSYTYVAAIIGSLTFAILWWYAWRSQQKFDS